MAKTKRRTAGTKKATRKVVTRGRRVNQVKRVGAGPQAAGASSAVTSLKAYAAELLAQRADLDKQISAVEEALQVMGAGGVGAQLAVRPVGRRAGGAGRGPRPGSLKEFILNVLGGGAVKSVKEITEGVLAAGYTTRNKTLAKSVGIALTEMPTVKKVARGKFRCK